MKKTTEQVREAPRRNPFQLITEYGTGSLHLVVIGIDGARIDSREYRMLHSGGQKSIDQAHGQSTDILTGARGYRRHKTRKTMKNYITAEEAQQFVNEARKRIERFEANTRSTWDRGIAAYAFDLMDWYKMDVVGYPDKDGFVPAPTERTFLNGATSWYEYAAGGCNAALIYDESIIKRLFSPSVVKRSRYAAGGYRCPISGADFIDIEAVALQRAYSVIASVGRRLLEDHKGF